MAPSDQTPTDPVDEPLALKSEPAAKPPFWHGWKSPVALAAAAALALGFGGGYVAATVAPGLLSGGRADYNFPLPADSVPGDGNVAPGSHFGIHRAGNVKPGDLNRQILMTGGGLGEPRHQQAAETLRRFNPAIEIESVDQNITPENAASLVARADIVFSCAPLFEERLLMNREAVAQRKLFEATRFSALGISGLAVGDVGIRIRYKARRCQFRRARGQTADRGGDLAR